MSKELLSRAKSTEFVASKKAVKSVDVPNWEELVKEFNPMLHRVITDKNLRPDVVRPDGRKEHITRIVSASQKIAAKRMTQLLCAIPIKRIYNTEEDPVLSDIAEAIERVYQKNRIDAINKRRFFAYFSSCEMATMWYLEDSKNEDYGFESDFKIRSMTYTPMDRKYSKLSKARIYPEFDDYDRLLSISFETELSNGNKRFHYLSNEEERLFQADKGSDKYIEIVNISGEDKPMKKILANYLWRPQPIWEDTTENTTEIELGLSRQGDIIRHNSAPIVAVIGDFIDDQDDTDSPRDVFRLEQGGEISLITWPQQSEALNFYLNYIKKQTEEELQLFNLSLENLKGSGIVSGDALEMLLTEPHLKTNDEADDVIEFLDREFNVIKHILGSIKPEWADKMDLLTCDHIVTPYSPNDKKSRINSIASAKASGIISLRTAVEEAGYVENVDEEIKRIEEEKKELHSQQMFNY